MTKRTRHLTRVGVAASLLGIALVGEVDLVPLIPRLYQLPAHLAVLVLAALLGGYAIREGIAAIFNGLDNQTAVAARNLGTWALYLLLALLLLPLIGINPSSFVFGGAVLGVIIATIAQDSLSNFFAGLLLIGVRPYTVGNSLRMRSSMAGGAEYEGTVVDVGAMFTTLMTAHGETLKIPNSAIMTAALIVGQAPLQAEVEVELPPATALEPLAEQLRVRLELPPGAVSIRPRTFTTRDYTRLVCRLEIRSRTQVDSSLLAEILEATVSSAAAA